MAEATYKPFLALVRSVMDGTPMPEQVDWKQMYLLAMNHGMIGILRAAASERDDLSERGKRYIEERYLIALARRMEQERAAEELFSALREHGIRYMPLKGYLMRRLYPSPDLRQSGDLDVFYDSGRRKELPAIMEQMGYTFVASCAHHAEYQRGTVLVEMHHALTVQTPRAEAYYADIWSRLLSEDGVEYRFSDEDAYIYMMLHTLKHFAIEGGTGIRSVLDIAVYRDAKPTIHEAYLTQEFEKLGMTRFVSVFERLSRVWFCGEAEDEEVALLGAYIADGTAFGTQEQRAVLLATEGTEKASGGLRYVVQRLFPPYRRMRMAYPYLKRCPPLLPFFWVVRWCSILFSRRHRENARRDMALLQAVTPEATARMRQIRRITGLDEHV
jgi:hypothetical protein